jgi:hypothetical protein
VQKLKAFIVKISGIVLNSKRRVQAAHIERERFKCNIAHELKGTGMNTKRIE